MNTNSQQTIFGYTTDEIHIINDQDEQIGMVSNDQLYISEEGLERAKKWDSMYFTN